MSRSYYEWREAYNNWKAAYYAGISTLQPNPKASVVYTERSNNPYWARRQDRAEAQISLSLINVSENLPEVNRIGQHLISIGEAEFAKEISALKQMMPDIEISTETDELNFIRQFNIFLQGEAHYKLMIERLDKILNNSDKKSLAPVISSLYSSYLATALNQNLIPLLRTFTADTSFSEWDAAFNTAVDKSIEQAFERMLNPSIHQNNEIFGAADEFKEILAMWKSNPLLRTQFRDTIRSKINFEKILNDLQKNNLWQERARAGKKVGMRAALIDSKQGLNLKSNQRAGQIGGSVYEYIQSMFRDINLHGTITESGTQLKGQVVSGEMVRTDSFLIYSQNVDINIDSIVDDLNESLSSSTSLLDARDKINDFYERNLKSLKQGFIVYDSAKAYGTNVSEKGFKNGQKLPLERLGDYAADSGVPIGSIQDFLLTAYNTLPGAIYDAARGTITNSIENILYAAAAKLMFDDWTSIGEGVGIGSEITALHVFPLSGIYVPASYLFKHIGQALINADTDYRKWIDIRVMLPKTKTYTPPDGSGMPPGNLIGPKGSGSDLEIKQRILEEWNKQFQTAKSESEFSVHFLKNFKDLISDLAM